MATALSEEELDNEDYYSLLNVRREHMPGTDCSPWKELAAWSGTSFEMKI
uniref:DnaJ heat shock protein family (Hsp40) member C11 n=1 Tax=Homo sapiens TaxID=9606 RepID=A0A8I5KRM1_HUMAN